MHTGRQTRSSCAETDNSKRSYRLASTKHTQSDRHTSLPPYRFHRPKLSKRKIKQKRIKLKGSDTQVCLSIGFTYQGSPRGKSSRHEANSKGQTHKPASISVPQTQALREEDHIPLVKIKQFPCIMIFVKQHISLMSKDFAHTSVNLIRLVFFQTHIKSG